MNFLEKQIFEKFKKENWEIKTLEEISSKSMFSGNQTLRNKYKTTGSLPVIVVQDVLNSPIYLKKCQMFIDESLVNKNFVEKGDILLIKCDFLIKNIAKASAYLGDQKCLAENHLVVMKHSQNAKYLSYMLSTHYVRKQINSLYTGDIKSSIKIQDLKKIKIPIPSLSVQSEIVEFLDKFINLKHEMEVEMEKRSKQYEYYKELIFS